MKRKYTASFIMFLIGFSAGILFSTTYHASLNQTSLQQVLSGNIQITPAATTSAILKVSRVIDGDTIELNNGQKVRYIGIDAPELHHPTKPVQCFGKEAAEKNKDLVDGKTVRLEKDVSETDKYGRLLRYVYIDSPNGAIFVNDYLVKEGYAHAATFPPDVKYQQLFKQSELQAMQENKGLWASCK